MSSKKKRKKNFKSAVFLTTLFTSFLAYAVYTSLDSDGFDEEEVYRINNVAMNVLTDTNFSGRVVSEQPTLTLSGDKNKVKNMKKDNEIPEIILDIKDKNKEGVYEVTPVVKDKKLKVDYTFKPSSMEVKLIESKVEEFNVVERDFGLAKNGYTVGKMVASEKVKLKVTEEDKLLIGNVIVEIDNSLITKENSDVVGKVLVLDKKGKILPDIKIKNAGILTNVTLSKMGWLKVEEDIESIKKELVTLKSELKEKEALLKKSKDVLRKRDLKKEVKFRKSRIASRTEELKTKESSISVLKKTQEDKKKSDVKLSITDGGEVDAELIKK